MCFCTKQIRKQTRHFTPQKSPENERITEILSLSDRNLYHHDAYRRPEDDYIVLTAVLRRGETGFGFRILGGNSQDEPVSAGNRWP